MKRKINLVGQNTLTVSLPTKWVKENNVKKGDELSVFLQNKDVVFSVSDESPHKKEIILNIDNMDYTSLCKYIYLLYKSGFSKITLTYSKKEIVHFKKDKPLNLKSTIRTIVSRFVGAEIVSQSDLKTEIECFVSSDKKDLLKIEQRISFLISDFLNQMLGSIGPNYSKFHEEIYSYHDSIVKFILYFLKCLHDSEKSEYEKKAAYAFYLYIDQIIDKIRHISEKINEYGCTPKIKKYLEESFNILNEQFKLLEKNETSQDLLEKRYDLKRKIDKENFTAKELKVLSEANIFLETFNWFFDYVLAKQLNETKKL